MRSVLPTIFLISLCVTTGCSSKFAESTTTDSNSEGTNPGDCSDGADNDADSLFDCDDSGCAGSPFCTDGEGSGDGGGGSDGGSGTGGDSGGGPIDDDGDGYSAADDCNDNNAAINPSAAEVCDGIDNDCSGAIDDNPIDGMVYYPDSDLDGYGENDAGVTLCAPTTGFVVTDGDCDDDDPMVFPGVAESCDGIDQDCNGQIDEGLETTRYFADTDRDTFGDPESSVDACRPPDGHVENAEDCDDSRYSVNPEGTEVSWSDIDEDCDGYDLDFMDCAEDAVDTALDNLTDDDLYFTISPTEGLDLSIGFWELYGQVMWLEDARYTITPTAEYDEYRVNITLDMYAFSILDTYSYWDYLLEIELLSVHCEISTGPVELNLDGTMRINPYEDHATSSIVLDEIVLDDPSATSYFDGCSLDLLDTVAGLAGFDVSFTEMVDNNMNGVAGEVSGVVAEQIEEDTPTACRP